MKIEDQDRRKQELHYGSNAKKAYNKQSKHRAEAALGLRHMACLTLRRRQLRVGVMSRSGHVLHLSNVGMQ